jgi:uncharacterized integral membrane protein (TIGR00697 family)
MKTKDQMKHFKYLDIITALFVATLLISNIVSSKITVLGPLTLDSGTILFPLCYIFGDVLTEVYGYSRSRRVIWIGLSMNLLMAVILMIVGVLPSAPSWHNQQSYNDILGLTARIVAASIIAFFVGEFSNSFVLSKMKLFTNGKHLWTRTIGSTLVGEFFDTLLFILIAFTGVMPTPVLIALLVSNYVFKCGVEILFTPITYAVVTFLKRAEHEDYYDRKTNFNPFAISNLRKAL